MSGCFSCLVNGRVHHSGEDKTDGLFNITEIDAYNRQLLSMRDFQERDADLSNSHRFEKLVSHSCNAVAVPPLISRIFATVEDAERHSSTLCP